VRAGSTVRQRQPGKSSSVIHPEIEPAWWEQYQDLGSALTPYIGLEQNASAITSFAAFYVPALLQTAEYARAIIAGIAPGINPDVLSDRVEARLRRQDILNSDHPPRYRVLIDEGVFHRPTGGAGVMVGQIDKILDFIEADKVIAQVVPFDVGVIAAQDSNFILLEFDDRAPTVFVERLQDGQILDDEPSVRRYREAIDNLRDSALTTRETNARFTQLRKTYDSARS
jgi:Domain of unknown function (DUF5753)